MRRMMSFEVRSRYIEDGVQKYPDHVDEVPVKTHIVEWRVIPLADVVEQHRIKHDHDKADADEQMNAMQSGHHEIEEEKQLHLMTLRTSLLEAEPRQLVIVIVDVVFGELDGEKGEAQKRRNQQQPCAAVCLAGAAGVFGKRHG